MIQAKFGLNWPSGFRGEDFLDLNSYEEYPEDDPKDSVQVLRKSKLKGKECEIYKKQMKYTAVNSSPILSGYMYIMYTL
jgi:hypothetical protein